MLEGVWSVLAFLSDIVENVSSKSGELVAKKEVGEKDLHNAVDERQDLYSKKPVMKTILAIIMLTFSRSFMSILIAQCPYSKRTYAVCSGQGQKS